MDYSAMIENRKSVRAFRKDSVSDAVISEIDSFYRTECHRLVPAIRTQIRFFGIEAREALEGAAGYNDFLVGAPQYLVLLSENAEYAEENAGYMMEDMVLKMTDMGIDSCWLTFFDASRVKEALKLDTDMQVAAIVAFGYGEKKTKRMRLNILSMANVTKAAKRHYYDPKVSIDDIVFMDRWGQSEGVEDHIGFYDDILWNCFRAATLSPSYMNRQPYGFVIHGQHQISLIRKPDEFTDDVSAGLNLGIVMLHFAAVAEQFGGKAGWKPGDDGTGVSLPEGFSVAASCDI
ncbi:MAG: nitroreductase family protein [Lachnospiraceae bacterium]|nr:nitroreductase family protein [Lachnospiraceae bacterium]